jgi:hypothetical protein
MDEDEEKKTHKKFGSYTYNIYHFRDFVVSASSLNTIHYNVRPVQCFACKKKKYNAQESVSIRRTARLAAVRLAAN